MSKSPRKKKDSGRTKYHVENIGADQQDSDENLINYGAIFSFASIFLCSLLYFYMIYLYFPDLEESEKEFIKLPTNLADAKNLGIVLKKYSNDHFYIVLLAFFSMYVFMQSFCVPGSIFLSIMSGFLYPFPLAIAIVCTCSALGATCCFYISFLVARKLVLKHLKERITNWQAQVHKQRGNMLFYIIFLRITPFVPNWFINLCSPVINVPLFPFAMGSFIGVAPPSCFYVTAGQTLQTLTSSSSVITWESMVMLALGSLVALLPVFFKNQLAKRVEANAKSD